MRWLTRRDHAQRCAIALQALLAGYHHRLALAQALGDFYLAQATHAQRDLLPQRHKLGVWRHLAGHRGHRLRGHHRDDKLAPALGHDGLFRHHQSRFIDGEHAGHAGKHARAQRRGQRTCRGPAAAQNRLARIVGQDRAHAHRTAIHVQQRVKRLNAGLKRLTRKSVQRQFHGLLGFELALKALGQTEVDIHAAGVLQVHQVSAVFHVVTDIDIANTHGTGKRRQDGHARQTRVGQRQLRLRHLQVGGTFFQHALGHKILRHQLLVALVVGLHDGQLGLRLLHLGALQRVVQLHQQLAAAHV